MRAVDTPGVCEHCGYLGYPELELLMRLKPSALAAALSYVSFPRDTP